MRRLIIRLVIAAAALCPVVATAGNQQVAEQIAAALRDSGQMHGYRIGVKFQDGTAWLKGQVATREQMAAALELAFQVPGVTRVINHLTLQSEHPVAVVPDQATEAPKTNHLTLQSEHPVAVVPDQATEAPKTNHLTLQSEQPVAVAPDQATGNQQVAEQIAAVLRDSGQMHGYRIGVKFQDGTAWLKGQVATREQMAAAQELAFQVPGVTRVINHLTLQSEHPVAVVPDQATEAPKTNHLTLQSEHPVAVVPDQATEAPKVKTVSPNFSAQTVEMPVASRANRPEKLNLAKIRTRDDESIHRAGLEEPTIAPPKNEPVAAAVPPKPMPSGYVQPPLPIARANGAVPVQAPVPVSAGAAPARYDQPNMPNYAWPSYAPYPNYAAVTYPKQYSPTAWPYIGPFYPYPQVPLGWRKVTLEWHDGWWNLDFDDGTAKGPFSGLFRPARRKY